MADRQFKMILPDGNEIDASLKKFTRGDIYGVKRREKRDLQGNVLTRARITADGLHVIPAGGLRMQAMDEDGFLVERGDTIPATPDGEPCPVVESIFTTGVHLSRTITVEEHLHHDIERTYVLESDAPLDTLHEKCVALLGEQRLLAFDYAWTATPAPLTGIVIPFEGKLVVAVGRQADVKWVGPDTQLLGLFEDIIEDEEFDFEETW